MNNMPKGFIEHFDDDRVIGPTALATEQNRRSARREELMQRILRKGKLRRLVEDLAVWWNAQNIHSIEPITHSLNYNAKMRSDFIPRGIALSEVLPFSQNEVRRIVEACGRSDILR